MIRLPLVLETTTVSHRPGRKVFVLRRVANEIVCVLLPEQSRLGYFDHGLQRTGARACPGNVTPSLEAFRAYPGGVGGRGG